MELLMVDLNFWREIKELIAVPVNPILFLKKVNHELTSRGVLTTPASLRVLKRQCYLLNFAQNNFPLSKVNNDFFSKPRIYAYPAQTGIGKSVSLQVYTALLANTDVRSLIVVSRVEEAIKYCEEINKMSYKSYAQCYYRVSNENEEHHLRVDFLGKLGSVQCLVITHAMFLKAQRFEAHVFYQFFYYGTEFNKLRTNIVIDENINHYHDYRLSLYNLQNLNEFIDNQLNSFPSLKNKFELLNLQKTFTALELFVKPKFEKLQKGYRVIHIDKMEIHDALMSMTTRPIEGIENLKNFYLEVESQIDKQLKLVSKSIDFSKLNFKEELEENNILGLLLNKHSPFDYDGNLFTHKEKKTTRTLDKTGEEIFIDDFNDFMLYKGNKPSERCLFNIISLPNYFKSAVVLDATAQINAFYKYATKSYIHSLVKVSAPQVRQYSNLTVNIAVDKKYSPSRSNFYIDKDQKYKKEIATEYLDHALRELLPNDQMLFICHKEMRKTFISLNKSKQIEFTHWGDHVGKNNWSHCSKVFVAGWNTLNEFAHVSSILSSGHTDQDLYRLKAINQRKIVDEFKITQLADDLVQAVMRSQARIIDTIDSDCKPATIYLMHNGTSVNNDVINLFLTQVPQAHVNLAWKPKGQIFVKKLTKTQQNQNQLFLYIQSKLKNTGDVILRKSVENSYNISTVKFSRWVNSPYFKFLLEQNNIKLVKVSGNKKSDQFVKI
jgi:hypothetical protein